MRATALIVALCAASIAVPVSARDALGVFEDWGAFRDPATPRCYAIAEPDSASSGGFYATVGFWPRDRVRAQIFVRFPRGLAASSQPTLRVGGQNFTLTPRGRGAWAVDARMDAVIVAAMRSAGRMEASGRDTAGALMTGSWRLRGAATAIDAAALGCARRG
ncbi:MAG: hypothetical protein MUF41_06895 [Sphingopyxis sp.]|nr:hypothetical protein [Sphingopyxis sp.]